MPYHKLKRTLALPREEDERFTFAEIEEGVYFRGHNLWLLVLSMAIASIGLKDLHGEDKRKQFDAEVYSILNY